MWLAVVCGPFGRCVIAINAAVLLVTICIGQYLEWLRWQLALSETQGSTTFRLFWTDQLEGLPRVLLERTYTELGEPTLPLLEALTRPLGWTQLSWWILPTGGALAALCLRYWAVRRLVDCGEVPFVPGLLPRAWSRGWIRFTVLLACWQFAVLGIYAAALWPAVVPETPVECWNWAAAAFLASLSGQLFAVARWRTSLVRASATPYAAWQCPRCGYLPVDSSGAGTGHARMEATALHACPLRCPECGYAPRQREGGASSPKSIDRSWHRLATLVAALVVAISVCLNFSNLPVWLGVAPDDRVFVPASDIERRAIWLRNTRVFLELRRPYKLTFTDGREIVLVATRSGVGSLAPPSNDPLSPIVLLCCDVDGEPTTLSHSWHKPYVYSALLRTHDGRPVIVAQPVYPIGYPSGNVLSARGNRERRRALIPLYPWEYPRATGLLAHAAELLLKDESASPETAQPVP